MTADESVFTLYLAVWTFLRQEYEQKFIDLYDEPVGPAMSLHTFFRGVRLCVRACARALNGLQRFKFTCIGFV